MPDNAAEAEGRIGEIAGEGQLSGDLVVAVAQQVQAQLDRNRGRVRALDRFAKMQLIEIDVEHSVHHALFDGHGNREVEPSGLDKVADIPTGEGIEGLQRQRLDREGHVGVRPLPKRVDLALETKAAGVLEPRSGVDIGHRLTVGGDAGGLGLEFFDEHGGGRIGEGVGDLDRAAVQTNVVQHDLVRKRADPRGLGALRRRRGRRFGGLRRQQRQLRSDVRLLEAQLGQR